MKKKKKLVFPILALVFIICIFEALVLIVVTPNNEYSSTEKRNLAQTPELTIDNLVSGEFMDATEKYMADQFMFRDFWMNVRTRIDLLLGFNISQGVYNCEDGYLIQKFEEPDQKLMLDTIVLMNEKADKYKNSNFYICLVPNAVYTYSKLLPTAALNADQKEYMNNFYSKLSDKYTTIDISDELSAKKDTQLYYRTDHHWTTDAAYVAYDKIKKALGLNENIEYVSGIVCNSFSGSMASKSGYSPKYLDSIKVYLPKEDINYTVSYIQEQEYFASCYNTECLMGDDPYQIFFGGNHGLIEINTDADSDKKILMFKDSYANCFVPFLLGHYKNITVVDPRYYDGDIDMLIQMNGFDDILFLYNINTISEDNNLKTVLKNDQ